MGINLGDVIVEDGDIHGDGVNVAARLEGLAEPGGICVSAVVHDQVQGRVDCGFEDLGEQRLKNIARSVRVYRVRSNRGAVPAIGPMLALPDKPSLAVLPFHNMSGDAEQEFFADGIAEDVITLVSKSHGLFVIARNSSFTYRSRTVDVKQVGRELGVRYVLEGSVRKAGDRVRVTAQLIKAASGGHLWAERYDRDLTDIFAVQDDIAGSVSAAILPTVERSERERAARTPPGSLDAWECYHRGLWHFAKFEPAENVLATGFFERATELDREFSAAHAALAEAYLIDANIFRPQSEREVLVPRATEHARQSVVLDPTEARGHAALAKCLLIVGRHAEALVEGDLAVSLDPNSAMAHFAQGFARAFSGRPADAIAPLKLAIRLSPVDPSMAQFLNCLARAYYWMGDYHAALATGQRLRRTHPSFQSVYRTLIAALGQTGQAGEAQSVMAEALRRFGEDFRSHMVPLHETLSRLRLTTMIEDRPQDRDHLLEGYRKAGVLD